MKKIGALLLALELIVFISACKITVDKAELTEIEITTQPAKTEYSIGEEFDRTDLKVTAKYSEGTSKDVTEFIETTDFDSSAANENQTITVTYEEKTAEFTVKIKEPELTGIEITNYPTKTEYCIGEKLDISGMKVTAYYKNGSSKDESDELTTSGFNSKTPT